MIIKVWFCPECIYGPVKVDEDGCCATCGVDCLIVVKPLTSDVWAVMKEPNGTVS